MFMSDWESCMCEWFSYLVLIGLVNLRGVFSCHCCVLFCLLRCGPAGSGGLDVLPSGGAVIWFVVFLGTVCLA